MPIHKVLLIHQDPVAIDAQLVQQGGNCVKKYRVSEVSY